MQTISNFPFLYFGEKIPRLEAIVNPRHGRTWAKRGSLLELKRWGSPSERRVRRDEGRFIECRMKSKPAGRTGKRLEKSLSRYPDLKMEGTSWRRQMVMRAFFIGVRMEIVKGLFCRPSSKKTFSRTSGNFSGILSEMCRYYAETSVLGIILLIQTCRRKNAPMKKGASSTPELETGIPGGNRSLLGEIADRILIRDVAKSMSRRQGLSFVGQIL